MFKSIRSSMVTFSVIFLLFAAALFAFPRSTNIHNDSYITAYNEQYRKVFKNVNSKKINSELQKIRKSIECLALNIYFESAGEPFLGQVAVARVVMNRVNSGAFPNTPCKVIYQAHEVEVVDRSAGEIVTKKICQFSWVCDESKEPERIMMTRAYKQAVEIAERVLLKNEWADLFSTSVLYFHNLQVNPKWNLEHVITIGNHKFFSNEKNDNP